MGLLPLNIQGRKYAILHPSIKPQKSQDNFLLLDSLKLMVLIIFGQGFLHSENDRSFMEKPDFLYCKC